MSNWRTHEKYLSQKRQEQIAEIYSHFNWSQAEDFEEMIEDTFKVSFYSDLIATEEKITKEEWKLVLKDIYQLLNRKHKELFDAVYGMK